MTEGASQWDRVEVTESSLHQRLVAAFRESGIEHRVTPQGAIEYPPQNASYELINEFMNTVFDSGWYRTTIEDLGTLQRYRQFAARHGTPVIVLMIGGEQWVGQGTREKRSWQNGVPPAPSSAVCAQDLEPERFCARCGEQVHEEVVYEASGWLGPLGVPLKSLGLAGSAICLVVALLSLLHLSLVGGEGGFVSFIFLIYSASIGAVCLLIVFPIGLLLSQEKSRSYRCPACGHVGHKALCSPRGSRDRR